MEFGTVGHALYYLMNFSGTQEYSTEKLEKALNLLKRFVHSPSYSHPEIRDYSPFSEQKKRRPSLFIANSEAYTMTLFDFDKKTLYKVSFGDLNMDNVFRVEVVMQAIKEHEVKSNAEAMEILKEIYSEVEYDQMNDSVDYHSRYEDMKRRKREHDVILFKKLWNIKFY